MTYHPVEEVIALRYKLREMEREMEALREELLRLKREDELPAPVEFPRPARPDWLSDINVGHVA